MGKRKQDTNNENDEKKPKKERKISTPWLQEETERFCGFVMQYSCNGILNKSTNGATNERKKREWEEIRQVFNSHPLAVYPRDEAALQARFKRVMFELRLYAKWERQNSQRTGGGPPDPKPKDVKVEVTGALLELYQHFGNLMSGLNSFDCDQPLQLVTDKNTNVSFPAHTNFEKDHVPVIQQNSNDSTSCSIPQDLPVLVIDAEQGGKDLSEILQLPTSSPDAIQEHDSLTTAMATDFLSGRRVGPQQFFHTSEQRRRRNNINRNTMQHNEQDQPFADERRKFIEAERQQSREYHDFRIEEYRRFNKIRLQTLRAESASRVAFLHAEHDARMRHRETLFQKQIEFWNIGVASLQTVRGSVPATVSAINTAATATVNLTKDGDINPIDASIGIIKNATYNEAYERSNECAIQAEENVESFELTDNISADMDEIFLVEYDDGEEEI